MSADRGTSDVLQSARHRLGRVQQLIDEITTLGERGAVPGMALTRQIEEAEREVARLQTQIGSRETGPSPLSNEMAKETSSIESARLQLNDAHRRDADVKQQWRELMIELDLTPNLTPVHAREVLAEHRPTPPPPSARCIAVGVSSAAVTVRGRPSSRLAERSRGTSSAACQGT